MNVFAKVWINVFRLCLIGLFAFSIPVESSAQSDEATDPFISGGLAWSPDGEAIAVATSEGIWLHQASDLTVIGQLLEETFVTSIDWSSTEKIVIGTSEGVLILDVVRNQVTSYTSDISEQANVTDVKWSPDNTMFAAVLGNSLLYIWDTETGQLLHEIHLQSGRGRYDLSWSPNSQQIAINVIDSEVGPKITIWDVITGEIATEWITSHLGMNIDWNSVYNLIATGGTDGFVRLWDAETGELQYTLEADLNVVMGIAWRPDGRQLASVGIPPVDVDGNITDAGKIRFWDGVTGHLITELNGPILIGDVNLTNVIGWSPNGDQLASVSDDGKIYLWGTEHYDQIAVYEGYRSIIRSD